MSQKHGTSANMKGIYVEFQTAVLRALPRDIREVDQHYWIKHGEELTEALRASLMTRNHIIDCSADPFVPERWSVEEHRRTGNFVWNLEKIRLHRSHGQGIGEIVSGFDVREELKEKPILNANVLDYLYAHPELFREEWEGERICFWGTIYRHLEGYLGVRYLRRNDGELRWGMLFLKDTWHVNDPAAVSTGI